MNEQLRFHASPVMMGLPLQTAVAARRLDTRTLEIGRRGVAEARTILAARRGPSQGQTIPIQVAEATRITAP